MQGVLGITLDCNGQCSLTSNFNTYQCVDLVNDLGIQCSQASCSTRAYNLSACVTAENGMIVSDMTIPGNDRGNSAVYDMTTEQSQAASTVIREETTKESLLNNCNTNQQSTAVAPLAIVIVILIVLVVIVSVALIWTCWTFKIKAATKGQYQQHR